MLRFNTLLSNDMQSTEMTLCRSLCLLNPITNPNKSCSGAGSCCCETTESFINQTDLKVIQRRNLTSDWRGAVVLFCKVETVRNLNVIFSSVCIYTVFIYLYFYNAVYLL